LDVLTHQTVRHHGPAAVVDTHESYTIKRESAGGHFFGVVLWGMPFGKARGARQDVFS
jgi:hypothetical protein